MELVTFLEAFSKDCAVCITNGRFVVYTGSIKQFLARQDKMCFWSNILKHNLMLMVC